MVRKFEYFVIFAEMRTGSNFLEENLNDYSGLHCYGEVFNPHFIGQAKKTELLGLTLQQRKADPLALLDRMKLQTDGLAGFRFFHDHDPRIKAKCLSDPACAKIILTRNPVETYVSKEIAAQTGQWRLSGGVGAKSAKATFDAKAFEQHLADRQAFQLELLKGLQTSGQTAFYIDYEDVSDVEVLNGLAHFLGVSETKKATSRKTRKQNPQPMEEKVTNFEDMQRVLSSLDTFNLSRTPNFEPRRGPVVPSFVAAAEAPVLFIPIRGGPIKPVLSWLAGLDGVAEDALLTGFTQKTLRHWKRQTKEHRSFAVLRHPVDRLHAAFVTHILMPGPDCYTEIRETLRTAYSLVIPEDRPGSGYDAAAHRAAFLQFTGFVVSNLAGQTGVRTDGAWASQSEVLRGVGQFMIPDHLFREADLAEDLDHLARRIGRDPIAWPSDPEESPITLDDIYDEEIEAAVKAAYQKDYMLFGFGPRKRGQAA